VWNQFGLDKGRSRNLGMCGVWYGASRVRRGGNRTSLPISNKRSAHVNGLTSLGNPLRLATLPNASAYHWSMPDGGSRPPKWAYEELVLACDLVMQNGQRSLSAEHPKVIELSELLRKMTIYPAAGRPDNFRNPNGVGRKTADIATALPGYAGVPTHGGALDKEVISEFIAKPDVMHNLAEEIRGDLAHGEPPDLPVDVPYEDTGVLEGRYLLRLHAYRERKPGLRRRKIESVRARGLPLACEVCGFDFGRVYGERGDGYIECHHVDPLHVTGERSVRLADLALLCSNCHRMIHTKPPWPTPSELLAIMDAQRSGTK
jgi:5-methylcytosine-specific restriction protein A